MSQLDKGLITHFPLDNAEEGSSHEEVSGQYSALLGDDSAPKLVWDPEFGRCFALTGNAGRLEANNANLSSPSFSISLWIKPVTAADGSTATPVNRKLGLTGQLVDGRRGPSLWWDKTGLSFHLEESQPAAIATGNNDSDFSGTIKKIFTLDTWTHVVWMKSGRKQHLYIDGKLAHSAAAPAMHFASNTAPHCFAASAGNDRASWIGRMAQIRVYQRQLTDEEIWDIHHLARHIPFDRVSPVDFKLYDRNQDPVIYISDAPDGPEQNLHIDLQNKSGAPIYFAPLSGAVSSDNHHIHIRFKEGVFQNPKKVGFEPSLNPGWSVKRVLERGRNNLPGTVDFYFLRKVNADNNALHSGHMLILNNAIAEPGAGTRSTRVELQTCNLFHDATMALAGQREAEISLSLQHTLKIVNHTGLKHIPLHVDFVGDNTVLNDGNINKPLTLRISNVSNAPISLEGAKLKFQIEGGPPSHPWALSTETLVKEIDIKVGKSDSTHDDSGYSFSRKTWDIDSEALPNSLKVRGFVDIEIIGIKTKHPAGVSNVYLEYDKVPGYWAGRFICQIKKSPLLFANGFVGIGVKEPKAKLHIDGGTDAEHAKKDSGYLIIGNSLGAHLTLDDNEIVAKSGAQSAALLYVQAKGGGTQFGSSVGIGISPSTPGLMVNRGSKGRVANADSGYIVVGNPAASHLSIYDQGIQAKSSKGKGATLFLQYGGGETYFHGRIRGTKNIHADGSLSTGGDVTASKSITANNTVRAKKKLQSDGTITAKGNITSSGAIVGKSLKIGGHTFTADDMKILKYLCQGKLDFDLYNMHHKEYLFASNGTSGEDGKWRGVNTWNVSNPQPIPKSKWRMINPR